MMPEKYTTPNIIIKLKEKDASFIAIVLKILIMEKCLCSSIRFWMNNFQGLHNKPFQDKMYI